MGTETSFKEIVKTILARYNQTPLVSRWEEATSSEPDHKPIAFWIRDSDDLVNIVWLVHQDIKDITWFPNEQKSTFQLTKSSCIAGFEVHEQKEVAKLYGFKVAGDYLIHLHSIATRGDLWWVASNPKETEELKKFLNQLVQLLSKG